MNYFPGSIRRFKKAVRILRPVGLLVGPLHLALHLVVMTLFAPPSIAQQSGSFSDSGVFQLLLQGKQVGVERFTIISSGGTLESTGELQMGSSGGEPLTENSVLCLDYRLRPVYYERQKKSPMVGGLTVRFGPKESSLVATTDDASAEQIFYLPDNFLVVLDTNFFHHYAFLLRQYSESDGGPQPFNVFIPQEAFPGIVHLERLADDSQSGAGLAHYRIVTDELEMDVWSTPSGAIQRILIPELDLEVLRQ